MSSPPPLLDVVVVGFNTPLATSRPVAAARESARVRSVLFCDNSTDAAILRQNQVSVPAKVVYLGGEGNRGIARAFNLALEHVGAPYVVLLDDDAVVAPDFFERVAAAVVAGPGGVHVPVVRAGGRPFSPCRRALGSFRPVQDLSRLPGNFSAVSSGMVIPATLLDGYRFDERLFLEFVDHAFVADMRRRGVAFTLMPDVTIDQTFSAVHDDPLSAARRHEVFRRDSAVYYTGLRGRLVRRARLAVRRLKLARMGVYR